MPTGPATSTDVWLSFVGFLFSWRDEDIKSQGQQGNDLLGQFRGVVVVKQENEEANVRILRNEPTSEKEGDRHISWTPIGSKSNIADDSKVPELGAQQILASSRRGPTGPRTRQGKERSRYNAVKHGVLSRAFLVKGESPAEYRLLLREVREYFRPHGTPEETLVERFATLTWRQRRLLKAESAEIARGIEFFKEDNLQR